MSREFSRSLRLSSSGPRTSSASRRPCFTMTVPGSWCSRLSVAQYVVQYEPEPITTTGLAGHLNRCIASEGQTGWKKTHPLHAVLTDASIVVMNIWPLIVEASNAGEQTLRGQLVPGRYHAGQGIFSLPPPINPGPYLVYSGVLMSASFLNLLSSH
ncbi:hypothetical protein E2C01_050277 [Portunus trituberculatus]|uniref:Uncharacterized protein n=1 Tax=Portunus trituberculatus TaxID=210409 RepID=A0A5B7GG32_PORTR|nr:hypothetical protein [Portunus trituberculatus]